MKPLYAKQLTEEERKALKQGLKSASGFTVRRAQMILMSAEEQFKVDEIGRRLGCSGQAVREAIHAFEQEGVQSLVRKTRARLDDQRAFDDAAREALRNLIQQSPRDYGYEHSLWSLARLAEASYQTGLTDRVMSGQTISDTLRSLGINWRRVRQWINSPDPQYGVKKNGGTG
jgi:biotin operon repressor